jgi:hypothetical protein
MGNYLHSDVIKTNNMTCNHFGRHGKEIFLGVDRATFLRPLGYLAFLSFFILVIQGCASVNTFPGIARAGDTVTIMVGGSEKANANTVSVTLTDANSISWDIKSLGLIRSVFNVRPDGRSKGLHYSGFLASALPWTEGHEPVQTLVVLDLPPGLPIGPATFQITTADDNSAALTEPFNVTMEIVPGTGTADSISRQDFSGSFPANFKDLEPAPHAKVTFSALGGGNMEVGAISLVIDFDEAVVNPGDISVYMPESFARFGSDPFGENQRMVSWRQDGQQLFVNIIAPNAIDTTYLLLYLVHPSGLTGTPSFSVVGSTFYDIDGNAISALSNLEYFP